MAAHPGRITELLNLAKSGNVEAEELRRLARAYLRGERRDHTLQTTALLHETYLRMMSGESLM
jgi:RNA polymerase sigma-70 factor (ECF subfamily)